MAAPTEQEALDLLVAVKQIGEKDAEELTVSRQDLRGNCPLKDKLERWSQITKQLDKPTYIGGTTGNEGE